jgi:hypothetical protein
MAERSKASVYGRSLAGISGSSPAGGMDVCVMCCKKRQKAKCRAVKRKKLVRMKYRVQKNKKKKSREGGGGRDFSHLFVPVLGPTQPPVRWVPG